MDDPGGYVLRRQSCSNKLGSPRYMSLGYAQKLSYKEDLGGSFGKPEVVESGQERLRKASLLADWVCGPVYVEPLDVALQKWFAIPDDNHIHADRSRRQRALLSSRVLASRRAVAYPTSGM